MEPKFDFNGCTLFVGPYQDTLQSLKNMDLVITSPPYNIGSRSPKKTGKRKFGLYDAKSWGAIEGYNDSLPEEVYQQTQKDLLIFLATLIKENGAIIYNHKLRHKNGRIIHPYSWFPKELSIHDEIVWDRGSTHNHCNSFCYPQTERLWVLKKSPASKIFFNPKDDGTDSRTDVWHIPPKKDRYSKAHCAPMPLALALRCIYRWCPPNGIVCDPYSGSGTTMIASYISKKKFIGSEKLEKYAKLSIDRLSSCILESKI